MQTPVVAPRADPTAIACEQYVTPLASPAESPKRQDRPGSSPTAHPAPPCWQDARPPDAGNLSPVALEVWRSLPHNAGRRFDALAGTLRDAPPVEPSCIARLLHCVAECDAEEAGAAPRMPAPDAAYAAALSALPEVPIPIAAALHIAKSPDGYMSAAVQSIFWGLTGERPLPPPLARWPTTSEPRCLAHRYVDLVLAAAVAEQHRLLLRQVTAMAHKQTSQNAHAPLTRPQHPPPTARGAALAEAGAGAVAASRQPLPRLQRLRRPRRNSHCRDRLGARRAGESYPIILKIAGRCRAVGRVRHTAPDDARCFFFFFLFFFPLAPF